MICFQSYFTCVTRLFPDCAAVFRTLSLFYRRLLGGFLQSNASLPPSTLASRRLPHPLNLLSPSHSRPLKRAFKVAVVTSTVSRVGSWPNNYSACAIGATVTSPNALTQNSFDSLTVTRRRHSGCRQSKYTSPSMPPPTTLADAIQTRPLSRWLSRPARRPGQVQRQKTIQ